MRDATDEDCAAAAPAPVDASPEGAATAPTPAEGEPAAGPYARIMPATDARSVPEGASLDHPHLYFNRELSTLDFNQRVLHQAQDARTPLLERIFFLAIAASNLDEFFRKRVGGLKRQAAAGVRDLSPDGRTPQKQLALVQQASHEVHGRLVSYWRNELRSRLADEADVYVRDYEELEGPDQQALDDHFRTHVFPILTPLAVDPGHPFPFLSNLSLSLAITLRHPQTDKEQFARIKVPVSALGRWVSLEEDHVFVPLEQVIAHNLDALFRGMEVVSVHAFRVTRNADVRRDEEEADDLLELISEELRERRFAPVVRLEIDPAMPEGVRALLATELNLAEEDVYASPGLVGHADCMALARLDRPDHRYTPWEPVVPTRLRHEGDPTERVRKGKPTEHPDIFSVIREDDLLVHHPYESFSASVQRFIEEAAADPQVLAIKQTLYRTSDDSPIVQALIRAAEQGKQVAVLVEVKARFDEENNIEWGRRLEKSGVHVTYGLVGLKTHAKATLVVRREGGMLRTYCHLGTGNYNSETARLYTDLGLITCDQDVGHDVITLFHYLTGHAPEQHYRRLLVAPQNMRATFEALVEREIEHQAAGGTGRISAKMNGLNDRRMIQALYRASRAGVEVDLVVRGHCRLRPGLPGYSENIRVMSILGRFLEHSRVYCFHNGGDPRVFIGSADWMSRNLEGRVEATVEIDDPSLRGRLQDLLQRAVTDRRSVWDLQPDGTYVLRRPSAPGTEGFQEQFMRQARA